MIHLFCGDDTGRKLANYEQFIESLPKRGEIFFINRNNFDPVQLENFYSGAGLFFSTCTLVFSRVLEQGDIADLILEKLEAMNKSENTFVFSEGKLNKPVLDAFKKTLPAGRQAMSSINVFDLPKEKKEKFNNFLVANAFGQKDKFSTWLYFRQAMDLGVGMEEIVGVLFWKIKDMMLRKDFRKFSEAELKDSATELSYLLPKARGAGQDAEASFEQFLLYVF